ncbi:transcriptional adapter 2-alpha-like [Saccostrea echinata]|uniref:transcriptional adapter 2-alpha-like n=1 Tax=Saccostrea echinata TaxID=191078 RepID=UPI002A82E8FB|nr:transcriptional adapter 2-alpha-like [Saccostrea echinata]
MDEEEDISCPKCSLTLNTPYILCKQCSGAVKICLQCFSKGAEFGDHENDHSYTIVRDDFPLFENSWSAAEELSLLKVMADCGYGNWQDVAQRMRVRGKTEVEKHYNKWFINQANPELPQFPEADLERFPCPVVYKLCDDPPRYPDSSQIFQLMGGYMAGRGDFNVEHDNFMELELRAIDFNEAPIQERDDLEEKLKFEVIDVYQNCLRDRWWRRKIIRKYGLINIRKHRLDNGMYPTRLKDLLDQLRPFMRLCSPEGFDKFSQALNLQFELRKNIQKLIECRENGITKQRSIKIFRVLKSRRNEMKSRRHLLDDILVHMKDEAACQSWLHKQAVLDTMSKGTANLPLPSAPRRSAPPMDIVGLPGYERLSKKERELCASVRLVPEAYLEFREILVGECKRNNFLRLQQARTLIKIDVNKTRKLYDFLVSEGLITKEPS